VDSDEDTIARIRLTVADNRVKTSRYTWWNFVPKNLFEQYSKASNIYFLVIMCMQMIKVISISDGKPAMLPPMVFVIVTSMLKDGYEDYKRHRDDRAENEELTEVYSRGS
jgi:phospholipid-transporting ATPase